MVPCLKYFDLPLLKQRPEEQTEETTGFLKLWTLSARGLERRVTISIPLACCPRELGFPLTYKVFKHIKDDMALK